MSLKNTWHHRRVAESAAKSCWICYKPSSSVLVTPDNKDFFYICIGHLKDRHFAIPDADAAEAAEKRKKDEEMQEEIEAVKKEYAEKMKKKLEKREAKKGDKNAKKANGDEEEHEDKEDEKERDAKIDAIAQKDSLTVEGSRVYSLHKHFFQQRIDRIRNAEISRRNRERLNNPATFPTVPSGPP